ncbi:galactokinase [Hymenobacter taeanensis]|uniref:Galactokinase n=1 Tax=Hymenobacter taeanensis TaxID=2735321 RepID=A0A6M6BHD6_9BACT|nr:MULTISPECIES: galactokinase [Hymenobacter]QJX47981.1 galactokinase [Hymenobacter taeanensis]UOQ82571.1 galactokinase [Hymenobacter sp. 5414T-23]
MPLSSIRAAFEQQFQHQPLVVRAPGRVNLIGEHTDYNNGFVLPAAIDREIFFAVGLNGTSQIRLFSYDQQESFQTEVTAVHPSETQWANYLLGVVAQFQGKGITIPGFDCVFGGNVPIGAGLSSSAAVECGLAFALNTLLNTNLERMQLARMSQLAEHTYAGVQCGIMDQFASLFGQAGHVVRLDCRSLEYAYFPFDTTHHQLVLCNSGVKHSLASSEYNTRRQECEQGVSILRQYYPEVQSLRDATLAQLEEHRQELGDVVYRRCSYVVEENLRVEAACQSLVAGDLRAFGQEMYGSHAGLRDKYEVSCPELDVLVELAQEFPGVLGSRMMGGGFGGCTINLVETGQVEAFVQHATQGYQQRLGLPLETYQTTITAGVGVLEPTIA